MLPSMRYFWSPLALQKLLMLYYEVARKHDAAGKLLPEMILVWRVASKLRVGPTMKQTHQLLKSWPQSWVVRKRACSFTAPNSPSLSHSHSAATPCATT